MKGSNVLMGFGLVMGCVFPMDAAAYPAGTVVSTGVNPVAAYGGEVLGTTPSVVLTASADQDFVVTDVNLMPRYDNIGCRAMLGVSLNLDTGGSAVAQYQLNWEVNVTSNSNTTPTHVDSHLNSGIRVPAGSSLSITLANHYIWGCGNWGVTYTLSGYHATP